MKNPKKILGDNKSKKVTVDEKVALKNQIKTDPHAPGFYRSYMPLRNVDEFYYAFNIVEGDKMYLKPEERVKIW